MKSYIVNKRRKKNNLMKAIFSHNLSNSSYKNHIYIYESLGTKYKTNAILQGCTIKFCRQSRNTSTFIRKFSSFRFKSKPTNLWKTYYKQNVWKFEYACTLNSNLISDWKNFFKQKKSNIFLSNLNFVNILLYLKILHLNL